MTPDTIERITLQSDSLRAVVMPQLGGKIASLALLPWAGQLGGSLLQGPLKPYALRTPEMGFPEADGSGWDECLPTVGGCVVTHDGKQVEAPDHGDFWRLVWKVDEHTDETLRLSASAPEGALPLAFERSIEVDGERMLLEYTVRNTGASAVPYLWSAHPLFAVDPGDRIILPHSVEEVVTEYTANGRLGERGSTHGWPFTGDARPGREFEPVDLTTVGQPNDGVGDKIVTLAPKEGWCTLDRRTLGVRVTLRFDPEACPWLGLWLCYGGWPESIPARKGFAVALEPCTAPVDSLAEAIARGEAKTLAPGEEHRWQLLLEVTAGKV